MQDKTITRREYKSGSGHSADESRNTTLQTKNVIIIEAMIWAPILQGR